MRFVIQRVLEGRTVIIDTDPAGNKIERVSGSIKKGFVVLCGRRAD